MNPTSRSFRHSAALLACGCIFTAATAVRAGDDLKPFFNGKDLAGWKVPATNVFWKAMDGVLVGENDEKKTGSMLWTEQSYHDFIFEADVRWTGEIDSGYLLRQPELQLQIGISGSLKRDMTCSFYTGGKEKYPEAGQAKDAEKKLKKGDWNKIRLQAKGNTFTAWLNGEQVSQYTDDKYSATAPIGLQIHPNKVMKVEFRNIKLAAFD